MSSWWICHVGFGSATPSATTEGYAGVSISLTLHAVGDFSLKKGAEEPAQQHLPARIRGLGG